LALRKLERAVSEEKPAPKRPGTIA
jgi:hypothetical protein